MDYRRKEERTQEFCPVVQILLNLAIEIFFAPIRFAIFVANPWGHIREPRAAYPDVESINHLDRCS